MLATYHKENVVPLPQLKLFISQTSFVKLQTLKLDNMANTSSTPHVTLFTCFTQQFLCNLHQNHSNTTDAILLVLGDSDYSLWVGFGRWSQ